MNGIYLPEINYSFNNNILNKNDNNNIILPIKDSKYETYTYEYMDLVYKSDSLILNNNNNNLYKNGFSIYGYYKNIWNDNILNNKDEYYTNFYNITIKGKYIDLVE